MRENRTHKIGNIVNREFGNIEKPEGANEDAAIVVTKKEPTEKITITKASIWRLFKIFYKAETGKDFIKTEESIKNIEPIIKYFVFDDAFFECENLVKEFNTPSFKKGLLIVGKFGNGKTTIMRTLENLFKHYQMPMRFKAVNAHDLVTEWESIDSRGGKYLFFERYTCRSLYIDDVKKEREASNYGKTEVIKDILEKRYDRKLITHITCNFRETDQQGNISDALEEFNRYGNHIYDRIFEMFNIIEFKGKSFRD